MFHQKNKNILFEKLIKTTNVVQLLIILEGVKTKGIRDQIIVKLKKIDIIEFLRKQNWRPEILIVVTKLALHQELIEQAQIAQEYWQKNISISKIDSDSEKAIFESKLIMAYQQKDKSAIQKVEEPSSGYKIHNELVSREEFAKQNVSQIAQILDDMNNYETPLNMEKYA